MKPHLKLLVVVAFAVPIFIELRTLLGEFMGFEISLGASVLLAVVAAAVLVAVDEKLSGGDKELAL